MAFSLHRIWTFFQISTDGVALCSMTVRLPSRLWLHAPCQLLLAEAAPKPHSPSANISAPLSADLLLSWLLLARSDSTSASSSSSRQLLFILLLRICNRSSSLLLIHPVCVVDNQDPLCTVVYIFDLQDLNAPHKARAGAGAVPCLLSVLDLLSSFSAPASSPAPTSDVFLSNAYLCARRLFPLPLLLFSSQPRDLYDTPLCMIHIHGRLPSPTDLISLLDLLCCQLYRLLSFLLTLNYSITPWCSILLTPATSQT